MLPLAFPKILNFVALAPIYFAPMIVAQDNTYKCYNGAITCTPSNPPARPTTVEGIRDIINGARKSKEKVKVIGNKHSISDCICTTGTPVILSNFKNFSVDPVSKIVTAGTGLDAVDFLEKLHQNDCGISGAPTFGGVTLGGVLAVGVHGTGVKFPTLLSDQLVSISFVDGTGTVHSRVPNNSTSFDALRVSLGLLGIIYEAQFECKPQYKLKMHNFHTSDKILRNGATELINLVLTNDVIQTWWFPSNQKVVLSLGNRTDGNSLGDCQTNYISNITPELSTMLSVAVELMQATLDHKGRQPFYSKPDGKTPCLPEATGWSHKMMSNNCTGCPWLHTVAPLMDDDINVAVPLSNLSLALDELWDIFENDVVEFPLNGLYFRFLKPGKGYMAINYGESEHDYWVSIEWITVPRWKKTDPKLGIKVYQAVAQVLLKYGGRSHWGKAGLAYTHPNIIRNSHGIKNVNKFIDAMNTFDPEEIFMNTFGERIKHGWNNITVAPDFLKHCALNECCLCANNNDCGTQSLLFGGGYTCTSFTENNFKVCQPPLEEVVYASIQGDMIKGLAKVVNSTELVVKELNNYGLFTNGVTCGIEEPPCKLLN